MWNSEEDSKEFRYISNSVGDSTEFTYIGNND